MTGQVLTEVRGTVPADHEGDFVAAYRQLAARPFPDGLLRTELLRGPDRLWRIQTLWRDQSALDAMRAAPEGPAAPKLFLGVGVEPTVTIFSVEMQVHVP